MNKKPTEQEIQTAEALQSLRLGKYSTKGVYRKIDSEEYGIFENIDVPLNYFFIAHFPNAQECWSEIYFDMLITGHLKGADFYPSIYLNGPDWTIGEMLQEDIILKAAPNDLNQAFRLALIELKKMEKK